MFRPTALLRLSTGLVIAALASGAHVHTAEASPLGDETVASRPPASKHKYSLAECLALAERNHPNLWAARARTEAAVAQAEETKYLPYSQFSSTITTGVIPHIGGTPYFGSTPFSQLNTTFTSGLNPFLRVEINGAIPLYTFGKIDAGNRAAEANVRVQTWDYEKFRNQARADVRRAYFGLSAARDGLYVLNEVSSKLDKAIDDMKKKIEASAPGVDEVDVYRLEGARDELRVRFGDTRKGESQALAGLRFLTGIQTDFDIVDEPLERPDVTIGPLVRYLTAARLYRPEINMARAGLEARRGLLDYQRARLFPDIGLGLNASYAVAPSATQQTAAWLGDPFNRFGYGAAIGIRWNLDLLAQGARIRGAEAQLEETQALNRLALGGIGVEVESQYAVVLEAKNREETFARTEHRAKGWIKMVQDGIDLGTREERQLLEPLRAYVTARASHVQALLDLHFALSELARVTGWDGAAPSK
jgi:outer membrane protein TolC